MKTHALTFLALAFALVSSPNLRADSVTYGPLTFGSNFPFVEGGSCGPQPLGGCAVVIIGPTVYENGIGVPPFTTTQITTFTFDIAPDWTIDYMRLGGTVDVSSEGANGDEDIPIADWGAEVFQELILCSDADVCSTGSQTFTYGGAPLPPPPPSPSVGPETGIYETFIALDEAQIQSDAQTGVDIYLSQTPEPSSWLLLSTGLLVCLVLLVQKRRSALR